MNDMDVMNTVSVERLAAFLDGNLADDDLQRVAAAIDADPALSDIVGEALLVDDSVEAMLTHPDEWQQDAIDNDYSLPVVPTFADAGAEVELVVAEPSVADVSPSEGADATLDATLHTTGYTITYVETDMGLCANAWTDPPDEMSWNDEGM